MLAVDAHGRAFRPWLSPGAIPRKGGDRPVRQYELVFIVQPLVDEEGLNAVVARVQQYIERDGGQVAKVEPWGLRRLAYPIQDHLEGQYVLVRFAFDPLKVNTLDRSLRLTEGVIRHLVVAQDETPAPPSE
jgi:small subunit ribosomal protein S6